MTPLDLAQGLARSPEHSDRALGVAMLARGLSDEDGRRQPWPVEESLRAAARYLHLDPAPGLIDDARRLMPLISDALLNRRTH